MKRNLSPEAFGACLLLSALIAGCGGGNETDLISSAKGSMAKKDFKAATVELKSVLQKNVDSAEAHYLLGVVLFEQGDFGGANLELSKARELGFAEIQLWPKLARAMLGAGKASALVNEMSAKNLDVPAAQAELHTALAVAQSILGNRQGTTDEIAKALAADPKYPWALQIQARQVAAQGNLDRALELVDASMVASQANGEAWQLRGDLLYRGKGDASTAIKAYEMAVKDPSTEFTGRLSIIAVNIARGQLKEAREQLDKFSKSHPKSAQIAFVGAQLAYSEKDFVKAKELVQGLLKVAPKNPQLLAFAADIDFQRGALLLAEDELGRAVQLAPNVDLLRKRLADVYLRMGQIDKAVAALRPLSEAATVDGDTLALLAAAHLQQGNIAKAEAYYMQAAKLKPQDTNIRTALALTDLAKGRTESAFSTLAAISDSDKGTVADMALISAHMRRGEYDAALKAIDKLQAKDPQKPTAMYLRGVVHRQRKEFELARAAFEGALKIEPLHFASVSNLASLDLQNNNFQSARDRLGNAIKLNPANVAARMALIDVMIKQGAPAEEITATLNEAIRSNSAEAAPHLLLIARLSMAREFPAALSAAQAALAALPDNVDILDAAGRAQANAGDDQQAISTFNRILSVEPKSASTYVRLADLFERRKDHDSALLNLRRAFDADPESREVQQRVVAQSLASKDNKFALGLAKDLQRKRPNLADGFLLEGDVLAASKNWNDSLAAYRQAQGKSDARGRVPISIYSTLLNSSGKDEADKFASTWLKAHPADAAFLSQTGSLDMVRKNYAAAEARFRAVLAIDPKNVLALNNLAWLLADRGDTSALGFADKAVALAPGEAPILDTWAKALALSGNLNKAIAAERDAVANMPDRHSYRLNLAKLYLAVGDKPKAKAELEALRELGAKFAFQGEVSQLLKSL